jgi:sulfonate transport system substrate-binding protein
LVPSRRSNQERRTRRTTWVAVAAVAAVVVIAGCSSSASTRAADDSSSTTTTAAQVSLAKTVPAGTELRVGDQLDYLKTILKLAHEDGDFPYDVKYAAFIGGPPMLQAFQGGAIDTGFIGTTPLIFAQAQGQDLKAVAGWAGENGSYGLITAPGNKDIKSWGDLKGKKVAYQKGTAGEAVLLQALDSAGVSPDDVTAVDIPQTQVSSALQGGSADAGISIEPLTSVYLAANPTAKQVDRAREITDRSSFLIAASDTLENKGKEAALADYIARLERSFTYLKTRPELIADAVFVKQYGLTPDRAKQIVAAQGVASFFPLPGAVAKQQQKLADLFYAAGQIPAKVDVSSEFDTRFNDLVQQEQAK